MIDEERKLKIKIIGVGGGGCNAISRIAQQAEQFEGVEFFAANTDVIALRDVAKNDRVNLIQLGVHKTNGTGAGASPEAGKIATEESAKEIEDAIGDANLLFITAGMGGGKGTGGAPVVARIAKERKILTIGVVTLPLDYEGGKKLSIANAGIAEMHKYADVLIVVANQQAFKACGENAPLHKIFEKADEVLINCIKGITDIIVNHSLINLDFADICTVIKDKKTAHIGLGVATGENRMFKALRMASNNELLNTTIENAKYLIVNIVADYNLSGTAVNKALSLIPRVVSPDATIIHGLGFDKNLKDEVHVTIIATGLYGEEEVEEDFNLPSVDDVELYGQDGIISNSIINAGEDKPSEVQESVDSFTDFIKKMKEKK